MSPLANPERTITTTRREVTRQLAGLLAERKLLTSEELEEFEQRSLWLHESLDTQLQRSSRLSQEVIRDLLSEITGIATISLVDTVIASEDLRRIPPALVVRLRVIPLSSEKATLTLACDHLVEAGEEEQIRILTGLSVTWRLCTAREMDECIKHYYGVGLECFLAYGEGRSAAHAGDGEVQPDITAFVRKVLQDALESHATDIHFEPYEDHLRLRYRIDGVLYPIPLPEGIHAFQRAICSCIKVMAQLNIAEKRLPQDGRFSHGGTAGHYDIRVSVLPTRFGEAIDLRVLSHKGEFLRNQELGLSAAQRSELLELISQSYGILLFTGPTGSGKTTSLYAAIEYLNRDERKIITLEDPVEYQMPGTVQLQVHPEIGFTFPVGLRSILRHDPDVVLIGEIRDEETARIAISAAMTGHMVFSTLHTNDSVSAATRLMDMGIEPYLLASSVQGIVAQRLLRRICPACKERDTEEAAVQEEIRQQFRDTPETLTFYRGRGCPLCRFMGYQGRQAIFELFTMKDELRKLIINRASSEVLLQTAIQLGLITLRQSAWVAALSGITTVEDVLRLTRRGPALRDQPFLRDLLAGASTPPPPAEGRQPCRTN